MSKGRELFSRANSSPRILGGGEWLGAQKTIEEIAKLPPNRQNASDEAIAP